jgi:hypothetical protein
MSSKYVNASKGSYNVEFHLDKENGEVEVKVLEYDPDLEMFEPEPRTARVKVQELVDALEWIKKEVAK